MRYLMALILTWGVVSFSSAQETEATEDCPKSEIQLNDANVTIEIEGSADAEGMEADPNASSKYEYEFESETPQGEVEYEQKLEDDGQAEIEYESEMDIESSDAAELDTTIDMELDQAKDCPNIDESSSDAGYGTTEYETEIETETNVVETDVVLEEERERSTFGKIWRAPFKLVGNIPAAAVSIVSETAEGAGHIVGAPFKGVAKLFGAEEDDNDEVYEGENM